MNGVRYEIMFWGAALMLVVAVFGGSRWAIIGLLLGFLLRSRREEG